MTQDEKISFNHFQDEMDNLSFMERPSPAPSGRPSGQVTPVKMKVPIRSGSKARHKAELKLSQSMAE